MHRCIELARLARGNVAPNPMVGAVLVYQGKIIGEGYHQQYGSAHAEVNCIASVKGEHQQSIDQSTLYVSLEPCAHFGKTPPCVDLVIETRIPKVVVGCRDPFVQVNGKGIEKLKEAGIEVELGILENECKELNKRFFPLHTQYRPYGMELYVDKSVLIPRPETEELVDWIVKDIKASGKDVFQKAATDADVTKQLKILDVGTGSGCIALALKKTMPKAEVWGCDVSDEALNVARRNGSDLDVRVDFQGIDFLDEAQRKLLPTVDIIVSNPPYIPATEKEHMNANVTTHEPHTALFVPDNDPLVFYKAIIEFSKKRLYDNGSVYLEIHENWGGSSNNSVHECRL